MKIPISNVTTMEFFLNREIQKEKKLHPENNNSSDLCLNDLSNAQTNENAPELNRRKSTRTCCGNDLFDNL